MSYEETVQWMFQQLPMYQNVGKSAFRKDLSNTYKLSEYLQNPFKEFKTIHVAGTNGKGSVSHMLASIFQEAGYKTGLYTSPHLKDFRERIKINGKVVSEVFVVDFIEKNKPFFEANSLSFFEMTVGMAFQYFAEEKVDIAIIEVGLGGRLDSTNIIHPEVSVITNIGLDHVSILGDTLSLIAREKAGIIKNEVPVVIGETHDETKQIFKDIAKVHKSEIFFADQHITANYKSDLIGNYQEKNIKTVLQTIEVLDKRGLHLDKDKVKTGLLKVVENTGLLGRWQILAKTPKIICDTGHNKVGLRYVMQQLSEEKFERLHIVFGVVADKDLNSILPLMPLDAKYYFCSPNIARGLDPELLRSKFEDFGIYGESFQSVKEALSAAKYSAQKDDLIFIGGSTFVVAEVV